MLLAALIMGVAGSFHCLGMCSPLVMAVTNKSSHALINRVLYNAGRIVTYGLLGATVASVGFVFPFVKYQNMISILLGAGLLVIGVAGLTTIKVPFVSRVLGTFSLHLKKLFSKYLNQKNYGSTFLLGSLNGILPCGLSFLALTSCLTADGPLNGFMFMLFFGLGTLPVMLGFTSIFHSLLNRFHIRVSSFTKAFLILSGFLLIARVFLHHSPETPSIHKAAADITICK